MGDIIGNFEVICRQCNTYKGNEFKTLEFRKLMKNIRIKAIKAHKEYEEKLDELRDDKQEIWEKINELRKERKEILDITTAPGQELPKSPRPPTRSSIYKEKE